MCLTNDCCDDNFNGRIFVEPLANPDTPTTGSDLDIDVVGKAPIRVRTFMRGTTKVFEISLHVPSAPTVSMSVTPSFVEYNTPFTGTFTVNYNKGSEDITTKVLSPLPLPVPDTAISPFTFTVSDTSTQVGTRYTHTFTVTDTEGQTASASKGIEVQYRYYTGLIARGSTLNSSTALGFTSGVGSSVSAVFGARRHYVNASGSNAHFCWLRPTDSPQMGTPVGDGNFPFETLKEAYTVNINGVEYDVIKTVNFYPTSTDVELSF